VAGCQLCWGRGHRCRAGRYGATVRGSRLEEPGGHCPGLRRSRVGRVHRQRQAWWVRRLGL